MGCLEMYCLLAKNHFGKSTPLKFLAPFAADATPPLLSLEFEARYFGFRQIRPCPSLIPLKIMRAIKCRRVEPYRIGSTDEPPAIGNLEYMFFTFFSQSSLHQSGALPCDVAKTQPTADHADLGSPVDVGAVCSRQRLQRRRSFSCCN